MQYYEINEQTARRANDVNSMSDYRPGSATEEYRGAVDKAAALVQAQKAKISPYYHDKLDALLDRYARRLADYYNAYYRNESACPSILVCGGGNFPVRKKQKQNARRESLWQEYKEIDATRWPQPTWGAVRRSYRTNGTGALCSWLDRGQPWPCRPAPGGGRRHRCPSTKNPPCRSWR